MIQLQSTYQTLPEIFFTQTLPTKVSHPSLILFNHDLCQTLNLPLVFNYTDLLSGNSIIENTTPIAQAYTGHQYGHFTMLGDGRALLLGELSTENGLLDIQLKGAGPTPYSRRGDGRATLSSMLREYIISEAMYALNVPTTRSLAVVSTGEIVRRERPHDGAILTRISKGHIRVGTFQYAAANGVEHLRSLSDYVINRYHADLLDEKEPYGKLFDRIMDQQAQLISQWQMIGFIHGVMNTDNMSIVGETIDYGPCAFMDNYHEKTVFSSIDSHGRYAYGNQPLIAQWNLARLAECFLPLFHDDIEDAKNIANHKLDLFMEKFQQYWLTGFSKKIGMQASENSRDLINGLLEIMREEQMDFTNTFHQLSKPNFEGSPKLNQWLKDWRKRIDFSSAQKTMASVNPAIIPRNHLVEKALSMAENGHYGFLTTYLEALKTPYIYNTAFALPPETHERIHRTYCGT
jgi:uncharacterized protein YdiU (UPF0061 family)